MKKNIKTLSIALMSCLCIAGCDLPWSSDDTNAAIVNIYNEAVANGFSGTYEQWLESIKGEQGEKGNKGDKGDTGENGITPILKINSETDIWEVSYDEGETWSSLGVKASGKQGANGNDAISPKIRINSETNYWEVSADDGKTWTSLNVKATGENGNDGSNGNNGITPKVQINSETNYWEVSYDNGTSWTSLGVKATGENGSNGKDGKDGINGSDGKNGTNGTNGNNGVTPKLQINSETNYWEVSYDNGTTWTSLGVKASGDSGSSGKDGKDAITYVPAIFNNPDGTKLYEFYYAYGTDVVYAGPTPTMKTTVDGTMATRYTFDSWDKSLSSITEPTIFTATYTKTTFDSVKITFVDQNDEVLYEDYYKKGQCAVYPYEQPFSYDSEYVYQFIGWDKSVNATTGLQEDMVVKAQYAKIPRGQCGEYPTSLVTDESLIASLDEITETDEKGYKTYGGERYLSFEGGTYTDNKGNVVTAGAHYYKVEPIQWRVLTSFYSDGDVKTINKVYLMTNYIIDWKPFSEYYTGKKERNNILDSSKAAVYANNYQYSNIRTWLNITFLNTAFTSTNLIQTANVYNGNTATNDYASPTTHDKVLFLNTTEFGFTAYFDEFNFLNDKKATTTEYARAAWSLAYPNGELENFYLCRTAYEKNGTHSYAISGEGKLHINYNVGYSMGVRPAINLSIPTEE